MSGHAGKDKAQGKASRRRAACGPARAVRSKDTGLRVKGILRRISKIDAREAISFPATRSRVGWVKVPLRCVFRTSVMPPG
ncbi:hypothetical protein [Azospirillum doebereinerae]